MQVLEPSLVLQTSRFFGLGGLYMFASTFASTVKGSLLLIALHSLMRGFRVRTGGRITSPSLHIFHTVLMNVSACILSSV